MQSLVNNLESITKCPVCNTDHKYLKALIVKEENEKTIVHVTCNKCKTASLLFVAASKIGIVSVGVLTDLSESELKDFFGGDAVSSDCVIEVHKFLKSYKGGAKGFI
jgi:hypothetical protein